MEKCKIKVDGFFSLVLTDACGNIIDRRDGHNIVTSAGKAAIAGLVGNTGSVNAFTYLAVGTGTTAAAIGDTTLQSETTTNGLGRGAATVTRTTTTVTNDTLTLTKVWNATGAVAVTEIGAFNASSNGTLLGHQIFSVINTSNGMQLTLTYNFQFS